MIVGINLRYLQKPITGIERATLELIEAIGRLNSGPDFIGYLTKRQFVSKQAEEDLGNCDHLTLKKTKLLYENVFSRLIWDLFTVGQLANKDHANLFWGPSFSLPIGLKCPGIVTIYDLAFLVYPEAYDWQTRFWHHIVTVSSARRARAILTISNSSKNDIIQKWNIPADRIYVIRLSYNEKFKLLSHSDESSELQCLNRYCIKRPFLLTVSQISPRKNIPHLLRVYAQLYKKNRIKHQLVLVGRNGWLYEEVYDVVREQCIEDSVIFTGGIDDEDLINLYNMADIFIYPSLYEGFGLPILEAMACGAPVIASNSSSIPEVVGDAGILVSPTSERELSDAIISLSNNTALKNELRQRGLKQITHFTWEHGAKNVLELFKEII